MTKRANIVFYSFVHSEWQEIATPYNRAFVDDIKCIDSQDRYWNPTAKRWGFRRYKWYMYVKILIKKHFPDAVVTVIVEDRETVNTKQQALLLEQRNLVSEITKQVKGQIIGVDNIPI